MSVLSWDRPEKIMSTEEWSNISADSAPPGVYVPNMSVADMNKWKAKLVHAKTKAPHVEIRKTFSGTQVLIIVALDGWDYTKHEYRVVERDRWAFNTAGLNVRISMNGPAMMTFNTFVEFQEAIDEARSVLEKLDS